MRARQENLKGYANKVREFNMWLKRGRHFTISKYFARRISNIVSICLQINESRSCT